jgi:hypothetical protein
MVSHGPFDEGTTMANINVRKGMPSVQLDKQQFKSAF